jgi:formate dehydrogenase major subunit
VAGFFVKRNRIKGVTIIVIDPNENETSAVAQYALRIKPGSDAALLHGLVSSLASLGFNVSGSANAIGCTQPQGIDPGATTIAEAAEATGIPAETLVAVSRELGMAKTPVIVFGKGITRSRDGVLQNLEELAKATGALLINPMGKANSHAAHAYGLDQAFVPGNPAAANPAMIYLALGDDFPTQRLESVVLKHNNPTGNPTAFLVVQASHASSITKAADVVLPVEMWAEQEGHYLNLEGRLQKTTRILSPAAAIRSNQMVFQAIAEELNVEIDGNWREALSVAVKGAALPNHADRS